MIQLKPKTAIRRFKDFVAIPFQRGTEESAYWFLIINDEYGCRGRIS